MSCGIGCRRGLDPELLWLWRKLVATALIRPLAWEPPYPSGVALEKAKRQKDQKKKKKKSISLSSLNHAFSLWAVQVFLTLMTYDP